MRALYILAMTVFIVMESMGVSAAAVNIYSHRQAFLLRPVLHAFEAETGIEVRVVYAPKGGLLQRMILEGEASPADVVLTSDIADMVLYAENGLLARHGSALIKSNIPEALRNDGEGWFAVSVRARVLALSAVRLPMDLVLDLEDLALPAWRGRICSRPGSHPYNRALMASVIAAHGASAAAAWGRGLVANLARKPQGNDRAQAKAVSAGICDIAIINSYYYGKMKFSDKAEPREWAGAVRLSFTNQSGRGNHINISSAALSRSSKNRAEALRFLEFLTETQAQTLYSETNYEYPANPAVAPSAEVASWGRFKADAVPIRNIAELSASAQIIIDRIGW